MSVWNSDEKLLSICILNFSFKNDFVWDEISNIRHSVSSPGETPRSSSKILRCALYFQLSSRCFIWWWNTASHVWYITWKGFIFVLLPLHLFPFRIQICFGSLALQFKVRIYPSYKFLLVCVSQVKDLCFVFMRKAFEWQKST